MTVNHVTVSTKRNILPNSGGKPPFHTEYFFVFSYHTKERTPHDTARTSFHKIRNPPTIKLTVPKNTVSKVTHTVHHAASQYFNAPIPSSLNWFFGLGFKLGLLVLLKSSLILFYLFHQLTLYGFLMIFAQVLVGFVLVSVGIIMQQPEMYKKQQFLLCASMFYGIAALISLFINWLCEGSNFQYFRGAPPKNWFVDFFTGLWSGIKEAGLSILFADRGLWIVLCFIMFDIAYIYLCCRFGHKPAIIRLIQKGVGRLTAYVRHPAP